MSHLSDELRIIRRGGWLATILVFLLVLAAAITLIQFEPEVRGLHFVAKIVVLSGLTLLPAIYVLLVAYVYADAHRRGMRAALWALLSFFVPWAIGFIVYFIMRDPLPQPCPKCGTMTPHAFTYCPQCGAVVKPSCPQCHRALQRGWTHCPTCGATVP